MICEYLLPYLFFLLFLNKNSYLKNSNFTTFFVAGKVCINIMLYINKYKISKRGNE